MPRFVIQEHQRHGEEIHWDLMLEQGEVLKTFRLNLHPEQIQAQSAQATPIADHDKRFLTYEGSVNRGQGSVNIVEQGTYTTLSQDDAMWTLSLNGSVLDGAHAIAQSANGSWQFQRIPAEP